MTQEIIVYRNPVEAELWHSLQDGTLLPFLCAVLISILVFFSVIGVCLFIEHLIEELLDKISLKEGKGRIGWYKRLRMRTYARSIGGVMGVAVVFCLAHFL